MKINYNLLLLIIISLLFQWSCTTKASDQNNDSQILESADTISIKLESVIEKSVMNSATEILEKKQVPILCYHRLEYGRNDAYTVTPEVFASHLKVLADSGYNSILPDELYNYLVHNASLPDNPFMITLDDSRKEHITIAAPALEKQNFRAAFFIMTVTNNKKNYLTTDEIAQLSERGHTVGLHSWDHVMVTKYNDSTLWKQQVIDPQKKLEGMINKPVEYWAYPNGVYNHEGAEKLDKYFKMSFILMSKRDSIYPLQTIQRMITPSLSPEKLIKSMKNNFN